MGSSEEINRLTGKRSDKYPSHNVYLDSYYIDKYKITNEQFSKFLNEHCKNWKESKVSFMMGGEHEIGLIKLGHEWNPSPGNDHHPAIAVTRNGVMEYAKWSGKRLPTEAEWEKAARGTGGNVYPWGTQREKCYHFDDKRKLITKPVGSIEEIRSPYGCYDMASSTWEWCQDYYDPNYYGKSPKSNPKGPKEGEFYALRGGSHTSDNHFGESSSRQCNKLDTFWWPASFRCAVSPVEI